MKLIPVLAMFVLFSCSAQADEDPFSDDESSKPRHTRIQVRLYEISLTELIRLNDAPAPSRHNLYPAVQKLQKEGKAKLLHLTVMTARAGEKAITESICEMIYPTEYEIEDFPYVPTTPLNLTITPSFIRPHGVPPVAFETRNVGDTLEIEPTISDDGNYIDLRLAYERVTHLRNITWLTYKDQWGKADLFFPEFATIRPTVAVTLANNRMQFIATFTPHTKDKTKNRRVLLFAKARVITP